MTEELYIRVSDLDEAERRELEQYVSELNAGEVQEPEFGDHRELLFQRFPQAIARYELEVTEEGGYEAIVREVNREFESKFGIDQDEIVGEYIDEHLAPGSEEARDINRKAGRGELIEREVTRTGKNGTGDFLMNILPLDPEEGYVIYTDIQDQKRREERLERYEFFFETTPNGLFVLDEEGNIDEANRAMAEMLGKDLDELTGSSSLELVEEGVFPEEAAEKYREVARRLVKSPETEKEKYQIRVNREDDERIVEVNMKLRPMKNGEYQGTIGVFHDITERVESRGQLEREKKRLEDFVKIVSHDLRNPMNVLEGRLEMAEDDENVNLALESLYRMKEIIDDALIYAREGEMVSEKKNLRLDQVTRKAWHNVEKQNADLDVEEGLDIRGDESRLHTLFENLYRNSVQHGGSDVNIDIGALDGFGFYYEDDGEGIEEDFIDDIFDLGETTSPEGTGFGLAIAEQIVEAHGWEIKALNSEEGGARFEVYF